MKPLDSSTPWVLLRVRRQLFGIPAPGVREMGELPAVIRLPNAAEHVLGLITLRGQVTPAIDLRRRMGLPAAAQDRSRVLEGIDLQEKSHRALWAMAGAAASGDPPHLRGSCPFDAWMEGSVAENPDLAAHFGRLERPHARLHAAAQTAPEPGRPARALDDFIKAAEGLRTGVRNAHPQIAVVLEQAGRILAVAVDAVESIERLKEGTFEDLPGSLDGLTADLTRSVARRAKDDGIVLVLDLEALLEGKRSAVPV